MRILLSGGGTMGPVSPLIAVYQKLKAQKPDTEFLFVGTKNGPEKKVIESYKIDFKAISSGKFRRYFSLRNLLDPFKIIAGFFQSILILKKFKPNAIVIAGGFVGVPVSLAANILHIPVLVHQQDILAGLSNKLMANTAKAITVSFEVSVKDFFPDKTFLTGNPVREEIYTCDMAHSRDFLNLRDDMPTLLVLGGGTGAQFINDLVKQSLAELLQFCQVVHIAGHGKTNDVKAENYHQFEFLNNEMQEALCAADLVVSRAGLSTLSELIILAKPTILIPIPGHQEVNAGYFAKNNAAQVLSQESVNNSIFAETIRGLIFSKAEKENLSRNIVKMMSRDGAENVVKILNDIKR